MKKIHPAPIRLRHARHYIWVIASAEQQYQSGGQGIPDGLTLFDQDRTNLDAARLWLQGHPGAPEIDALLIADAYATMHIGDLRYHKRDERIPQLTAALVAARRRGHGAAESTFLSSLGIAHFALGNARQAIEFHQQCLVNARELGDRQSECVAHGNLGNAYFALSDIRQAITFYQQALAVARELGNRQSEFAALGNLGNAYLALGDGRQALTFYQQRLVSAREIGDRRGEGGTLSNLGCLY